MRRNPYILLLRLGEVASAFYPISFNSLTNRWLAEALRFFIFPAQKEAADGAKPTAKLNKLPSTVFLKLAEQHARFRAVLARSNYFALDCV
jgi:hypothetical protein